MKNRFISLFLALALVFVSMTPVMANDGYVNSPSNNGATVESGLPDKVKFGTTDKTEAHAKEVVASKASELPSSYAIVDMFELTRIDDDETNVGFNLKLRVSSAKAGEKYFCVHEKTSEVEVLQCDVTDGYVTIKNIKSCSPFYLVKDTTPAKTTESTSTTKVVTCEDENGKGWVWSESKQACVYKVTNTSAK